MDIQVVFVKWGSVYSSAYVNTLARTISDLSSSTLKFVCITDDGKGLDAHIQTKPFPTFSLPTQDVIKAEGCRAKLAIFSKDIGLENIPSVYIDLDTMIMGDVATIAALQLEVEAVYGLGNHFVPHWKFPQLSWMTPENCFFINSSVVTFMPANHYDIFDDFNTDIQSYGLDLSPPDYPWHMKADERYISMHEKYKIRGIPKTLAGSFQDLYLTPSLWMSKVQDALPFVKNRRANRVCLTFHGNGFKPDIMANIKEGEVIRNGPLKARWAYPQISAYWSTFAPLFAK